MVRNFFFLSARLCYSRVHLNSVFHVNAPPPPGVNFTYLIATEGILFAIALVFHWLSLFNIFLLDRCGFELFFFSSLSYSKFKEMKCYSRVGKYSLVTTDGYYLFVIWKQKRWRISMYKGFYALFIINYRYSLNIIVQQTNMSKCARNISRDNNWTMSTKQ